jgi:opacity protein-like surface antigen
MTTRPSGNLSKTAWRGACALLIAASATCTARAADMPETVLRGGYSEPPPTFTRWDGWSFGGQVGYSNLTADFTNVGTSGLPKATSNSAQYGGFIGYNVQWNDLVVGFEGAYTRENSLVTSAANGVNSASVKLLDYATFRGRAGYAFGQFLPYAFLGAAAGRFNYATTSAGVQTSGRDNQFAAGFTAGLGIDVAVLPNVFVRAEYEYVLFSPFGEIRTNINSARAGIGVRF